MIREFLPGMGVENNPSKIAEHTKTIVKIGEEIICETGEVEVANSILERYWGNTIQKYYHKFYYISQEDRLNFLSQQEEKRTEALEGLLGLQEERKMVNKLRSAMNQFGKWIKDYEERVQRKDEEIAGMQKSLEGFNKELDCRVEYTDLFMATPQINQVWNQPHPQIESQEKLMEVLEQISKMGYFSREFTLYQKDVTYQWMDKQLEQPNIIRQYLYLSKNRQRLEELYQELKKYYEVNEVIRQAKIERDEYDLLKFNFKKICNLLQIDTDEVRIETLLNEIKEIQNHVSQEDIARENITNLQMQLQRKWQESIGKEYRGLDDRHCPLCGKSYNDGQELLDALAIYRKAIEQGKKDAQKLVEQKKSELQHIFKLEFEVVVKQYLQKYKLFASTICQDIRMNWENVVVNYKKFQSIVDKFEISLEAQIQEQDILYSDGTIDSISSAIKMKYEKLPDTYYEHRDKYQYLHIFSRVYEGKSEWVKALSEQEINEK